MKLDGKIAVVTGGGSGMGRQLVLQLLQRGARVAAADLDEASLQETAALAGAGDRLSLHVLNIADREAVAAFPAAVIAQHGAVDAVFNNAGIIQPFVRLADLDYDVIDRVLQVDLYGTIHMLKAFLPHLLSRPEAHIANTSSMGGFLPYPGQTMYSAAKAGVKLMTEGLYAELLGTRVGVSVILPGAIDTNIAANSGVTIDLPDPEAAAAHTMPADRAAKIILDGVEANRLHILVGSDARMLNLATRIAPKQAIRLIQRQVKDLLEPSE